MQTKTLSVPIRVSPWIILSRTHSLLQFCWHPALKTPMTQDPRTLTFDLGFDVEDLRQETKPQIVRDLIQHCERCEFTDSLIQQVLRMRPAVANAPQLRAVLEARARRPPSTPPPLAEALARFAELPTTGEPPPRSRPAIARLPYPPNPNFTGRGDDLRKIASYLRRDSDGTRAVAISGMGGLGKTQLATEFAHRYGAYFPGGVFWLRLYNPADAESEIDECGALLGVRAERHDERVQQTLQHWADDLPRLLIFDNCEDEQVFRKYFPPSGGCRALITRRNRRWQPTANITELALETLPRSQSVALLQKLAALPGVVEREYARWGWPPMRCAASWAAARPTPTPGTSQTSPRPFC